VDHLPVRPGVPFRFIFIAEQRVFAMVIECSSCRARYRMKESMMKGFKSVEVRCRKCGGTFVVVTPGTVPGAPEAATQLRAAPVEETDPAPTVPDNVYSLNRFREARPKRLPLEGYDISGTIRPEPAVSPAERIPAATPPLPAHREEKKPIPETVLEEPVQPPRESKIPEFFLPSDGSQFRAGFTYSVYPRLKDIAFVYLLFLLLGGGGYLLVHFLSRMLGGESG